jgi:hypothetical protein
MSVNAAVINQQVLMQQLTTQQTSEQASAAQPENAATTWQPEGMPPGLSPENQVNYAGQELYLYVDAIAHSPTGVINPDETIGLAYFINQFVNACNNATSQTPPVPLNQTTQTLYNDLTQTTYTVIIGGQTENKSLSELSEQIKAGGVLGYQSMIAMQTLFHNSNGNGADPWSPTLSLEFDLNAWEAANPGSALSEPFMNGDLQTLANQWNQTADNLNNTSDLEALAQDIVNVNNDITTMQNTSVTGYISPAIQLVSYVLNAPLYDGTSMVTLATNVVNDMKNSSSNLNSDLGLFNNAFQTENAYIGQFLQEATNPNYGPIPTTNPANNPPLTNN